MLIGVLVLNNVRDHQVNCLNLVVIEGNVDSRLDLIIVLRAMRLLLVEDRVVMVEVGKLLIGEECFDRSIVEGQERHEVG
jgi:hypothetical protein